MKLNIGSDTLQHGDKVESVVVPEHMRKRISLGIKWVDDLYGGLGTIPSTVTLFTGSPGAGKTTLAQMIAGAISQRSDAVALYNSREESPFQVRMTTERLGVEGFYLGQDELVPSHSELEGYNIHPNVIKNWRGHGSIIDHAKLIMDKNPGKDFFLIGDSIQTFNSGKYGPNDDNAAGQMRVIEQLTNFCKKGHNGIFPIVIIIGQITKDGRFAGKQGVKHAIDSHMHLYIDEDKKSETFGRRLIEMQKNRFGFCGKKIILDMGSKGLEYGGEYSWAQVQEPIPEAA